MINRKKMMGEILIEHKLITEQQLAEAIEMQKVLPEQTIGQILCRLGFLKASDLDYVLDKEGKRQKLVDILKNKNLIDDARIENARAVSKKQNIPLERALIKLNYVDEDQLARALSTQFDIPFVRIENFSFDGELARLINSNFAQRLKIVPISKIGNTLTLAMATPLKLNEIKELEDACRLKIISVIAIESEIFSAQQRLYKTTMQAAVIDYEDSILESDSASIVDLLCKAEGADEPDSEEEVKKVTERDSIIVKLVNKIIYDAFTKKASDIHIEPYPGRADVIVRTRVDGCCKVYQKIPYKYKYAIPSRIKIMADMDIAERRKPQDGKINFRKFGPLDIELRVATMPTVGGLEDVVLRILTSGEPMPFGTLGLTERNQLAFEDAINKPYGLILVVGPTGSGKTTTLHSAISMLNRPDVKIWTAEDPVEITQKGLRQVQVNTRIGVTFAAALRSFLRLDPDVIMVGEMRDEETASIAVEASMTGHLVLSTLHTNTAPETITRLLEMGLDPFSFSDSLLCILAQRLARKLCDECKDVYKPDARELDDLIAEFGIEQFERSGINASNVTLTRPVGCDKCLNTGYSGRLGIHELLVCTDHMKSIIKKKAEVELIRQQAMGDLMTTLKQDGMLKVFQGLTDLLEVRRVCIK